MSDQLKLHLGKFRKDSAISCLGEIGHGIEKESLRVAPNGGIARTPHPPGLGSALTHPHITTDFSEALLEFITPVFRDSSQSLAFLEELHSVVYGQLDEEILWTSSMPCLLGQDDTIPIAQYGGSNIGRLKTLYREGLSHRYGRAMQTIAGIHYNFSLSDNFWRLFQRQLDSSLSLRDFKTQQYFHLIRNFRRYSWLLLYLFGASPAVCKSFLQDHEEHGLDDYDDSTLYAPYGTSLRMGDLGYTSQAQLGLYISYNNLQEYAQGLDRAIRTPYAPYEQFRRTDRRPTQLNTSILQIENEFYSTIRPKREGAGNRPIRLLQEQGVEYIEVRCLDLNPFLPVGIDEAQMRFLNSFLIFCLLRRSPPSDQDEYHEIEANLKAVVTRGRDPDLLLQQRGKDIHIRDWAREILQETMEIAELMDTVLDHSSHSEATRAQLAKVEDGARTPSARVLQRMREMKANFFRFAMDQSLACSDYFRARPLDQARMAHYRRISEQSVRDREAVEAADEVDFDTYLKQVNES